MLQVVSGMMYHLILTIETCVNGKRQVSLPSVQL